MKYCLTKTRAAVSFACYQANINNLKVVLLDLDPKSISGKLLTPENLNSIDHIKLKCELSKEYLDKLEMTYDVVVIDSGLGYKQELAMSFADTYIVPFNVNDLGLWLVWTLTKVETMIRNVQGVNPDLKCHSFLVSEGDRSSIDSELVKVLKKSQYLTYLDSPALNQMLTGTLTKDLA
ncbi:MAG: hypothetical protein NE334_21655 [Lentisphaeraceae bacterium]|nr:hypothetical protein [Lentisphaeraceae bacterium]